MSSTTSPKLADVEIMGLIFGAVDRAIENFQQMAAELDLTAPQARAIMFLGEAAPMRALAGHLSCDASNVTGIADRLESRGLVRRGEAGQDRRVKLLALTAQGVETRAKLEQRLLETSPFMVKLSDAERATLLDLLTRIAGRER